MEITLKIQNKAGLHARPAAMLAQKASQFQSDIMLFKDTKSANAKSIISLMGLGIKKDDAIVAKIEGPDAAEAAKALEEIVNNKFGEE